MPSTTADARTKNNQAESVLLEGERSIEMREEVLGAIVEQTEEARKNATDATAGAKVSVANLWWNCSVAWKNAVVRDSDARSVWRA